MNLIDIAHLKGLCGRIGVENVSIKQGFLAMRFAPTAKPDPEKLLAALGKYPIRLILSATVPPALVVNEGPRPADELVRAAIPMMEDVADAVAPKEEA